MRINSLKISNVLGIRFAQVDITTPAVLFAGKNGAGKSSIQEAIRMALTGETARVNLKKGYDQLVTDGAKKGSVEVVVDRETEVVTCSMELPAGKGAASDMPAALHYVLDGARFASLDATARRKFLFGLAGVQVTPEEIAKRLQQRGVAQARIDAVLPLLRTGFEAAAKEAASKATQAKGAWREITGETYGSKKAEAWAADVPAFGTAELEQAQADLDQIEVELSQLAIVKGTILQKQADKESLTRRAEDLRTKAGTFAQHTDRLKAAQKEYEAFLEQINELREKAGIKPSTAPQTYDCPDCGSVLVLVNGKLVHYQAQAEAHYDAEAAARLPEYEKSLKVLENAVASRQRDVNEADQAATLLADIENQLQLIPDPHMSAEQLVNKEAALRGAKQEFAGKVQALRLAQQAAERAAERTEKAKQRHQEVQAWDALAEALSPDGIPGELMTEALRPINERLFACARDAGWARVTICSDMAITADGRPYALLSESEKWRTDALIAEAISHISGLKLLVLDRIDVLDMPGRNDLLYWIDGLACNGDIETALLFGTLKGIPKGLPETISGYWIENGEVVEQEQVAA